MTEPKTYPNLMAVLRRLQDDGYKVKKSKLYKDKTLGLIKVEEDGSVTESEMLAYITKAGLSKKGEVSSEELTANADRKFRAEIRKLEAQARASEYDLEVKQGKYILKEDAIRARIDQMQILEVHFRQVLETKLPEWIAIVGGNQKRLNDVRDQAALAVDDMMNALSRSDTFSVSYAFDEGEI